MCQLETSSCENAKQALLAEKADWRAPPRKCGTKIRTEETQTGSCYSLRLQERLVAYADLREFVKRLEKEGELKRIRAEVDPVLEIAEVTQRVARAAGRPANSVGPALLFEKPKGSRYPLLINAFGSVQADGAGIGGERAGRSGGAHPGIFENGDAAGVLRQSEDAAQAGGAGVVFPEECEERLVQGSDREGKRRQPF